MNKINLSVIIPCYNEQERFKEGFNHYFSYLKKQKYFWELILVNDGSKDKTIELMQKSKKARNNIKIINYKTNHGKGYAISRGVLKATGKIILFSDIDHSVPIETIESFFKYFKSGAQVVIGSRRVRGAEIMVHQDPIREFLGRGFTILVRLLIDWQVLDATCGFKAFENKVAKKIFSKITVYGWAFDAETLFICKKLHINLIQAPVKWEDARGTKVTLKRDVAGSLRGILKIRLNDLQQKYA